MLALQYVYVYVYIWCVYVLYASCVCESPQYMCECAFRYVRVLVKSSYCLVCPMHVPHLFISTNTYLLNKFRHVNYYDRFSDAFDAHYYKRKKYLQKVFTKLPSFLNCLFKMFLFILAQKLKSEPPSHALIWQYINSDTMFLCVCRLDVNKRIWLDLTWNNSFCHAVSFPFFLSQLNIVIFSPFLTLVVSYNSNFKWKAGYSNLGSK